MKRSEKIFSYFFVFGVIIGSFLIKILNIEETDKMAVYGSYFFEKLLTEKMNYGNYILYVFTCRLELMFIVFCITQMPYKKITAGIISLYFGGCLGVNFVMAVDRYKIYGVLIFLAAIFPQWIFYFIICRGMYKEKPQKYLKRYLVFFSIAVVIESVLSVNALEIVWKIYKY